MPLYLRPEQRKALDELALWFHRSRAAVVRDALDEAIERHRLREKPSTDGNRS